MASPEKKTLPKVFKDPVHGEIELDPLCVKIVDTPEFQRLRFIKQLGGCCYLYHGATHTRFEHSIGVCHLAGKLVNAVTKRLEDESSEDKSLVSDKEKLCVKIAGLCHDLGHGPYSHMFEEVVKEDRTKKRQAKWKASGLDEKDVDFIKELIHPPDAHLKHEDASKELVDRIYQRLQDKFQASGLDEKDVDFIKELIHSPDDYLEHEDASMELVDRIYQRLKDKFQHKDASKERLDRICQKLKDKFKHEDASKELVDRIYQRLKDEFKASGLDEKDIDFIKELIHPPDAHLKNVGKGKDEEKKKKFFLYEIVANKTCGVDVDKWDYFARDALYLGVKNGFDHDRLISSARACYDDTGVRHVAYRDKDISTLYEMFHLRYSLHRIAYQHRVTKAADLMIRDAMQKANDIDIEGDDGIVMKKISETPDDMGTYVNLNDNVIFKIKEQTGSDEARELVNRLLRRDLYTFLGEKIVGGKEEEDDIVNQVLNENKKEGESLRSHVGVFIASFDYGSKDKNPVLKAYFYDKISDMKNASQKKEDEVSQMMLPKKFNEKVARVYCKSIDSKHKEKLQEMVDAWILKK